MLRRLRPNSRLSTLAMLGLTGLAGPAVARQDSFGPKQEPVEREPLATLGGACSAYLSQPPNLSSGVSSSRTATGNVLFGADEYVYTLSLSDPLVLGPGRYFLELFNDTGLGTDDWGWVTGNLDEQFGCEGTWWARETPGVNWYWDDDDNMSLVLYATPILPPPVEECPPVFNGGRCACPEEILGVPCGCQGADQGTDVEQAPNRIDGGQTVLPHSGQERFDEVDLVIEGRDPATTLRIMRRHLTRVNQSHSGFGPAWAFNYRHYFTELASGDVQMFSFGRLDSFALKAAHEWEGGPGRFERLSFDGANTAALRMPGGVELLFHTETVSGLLVGHLTAVVSPNTANRITFSYESAAAEPDLLKRRLLTITESFGRDIEFLYQNPLDPKLVTTIRDFSGRELRYTYDSAGRMTSARSPVVSSTGGLNDFASGKTRSYEYVQHSDLRLTNALASVVYPNEQAAGQEPRLAWTYETDLLSPFFGYVTSHTVGNPSAPGDLAAGGVYQYSYEDLGGGGGANHSAMRTTIVDRRGTVTILDSNRRGQMLREEVLTRGFRSGEPASRVRTFAYNGDGDLTQSVDVLGRTSVRLHADPLSHPRTSQANETVVMNSADGRGGDQTMVTAEVVYEPIFNKPFRVVDPRGFESGNAPAQFTTTYFYDYMEDLAMATSL